MGAGDYRSGGDPSGVWFRSGNRGFCHSAYAIPMVAQTKNEGWSFAPRYIAGAIIGALVFVAAPETARWLHGGAFAQNAPPGTIPGGVIQNNQGAPNFNVPGSGNQFNIYPAPPPSPAISSQNPLGKYVCTTSIAAKTAGHYAILFEFGVRSGSTNGFGTAILIDQKIISHEYWGAQPLRTDIPPNRMSVETMMSENINGERYQLTFATPSITPQKSEYIYLETEQAPQVRAVIFLEDFDAISDQLKANALARIYDPCPR